MWGGWGGGAHLLRLQGELNENLLQLLVHKVDAELFKSIFLTRRHEHEANSFCTSVIYSR